MCGTSSAGGRRGEEGGDLELEQQGNQRAVDHQRSLVEKEVWWVGLLAGREGTAHEAKEEHRPDLMRVPLSLPPHPLLSVSASLPLSSLSCLVPSKISRHPISLLSPGTPLFPVAHPHRSHTHPSLHHKPHRFHLLCVPHNQPPLHPHISHPPQSPWHSHKD